MQSLTSEAEQYPHLRSQFRYYSIAFKNENSVIIYSPSTFTPSNFFILKIRVNCSSFVFWETHKYLLLPKGSTKWKPKKIECVPQLSSVWKDGSQNHKVTAGKGSNMQKMLENWIICRTWRISLKNSSQLNCSEQTRDSWTTITKQKKNSGGSCT